MKLIKFNNVRFETEKTKKADKIFKRLCKEIGIYPGKFYKDIIDFFEESDSYIFYGRNDASYSSYDVKTEIKFYRLQLDFAKRLIEENLLKPGDYHTILYDTLHRYDVRKSNMVRDKWDIVAKESGKKDFVDFFICKYQERIHLLPTYVIAGIYDKLPKS